jgi:hypothetical protein
MCLEPFVGFLGSEFPDRFFDPIPATSVFCGEYFFIRDTCRDIASATSGYEEFVSGTLIFLKNMEAYLVR